MTPSRWPPPQDPIQRPWRSGASLLAAVDLADLGGAPRAGSNTNRNRPAKTALCMANTLRTPELDAKVILRLFAAGPTRPRLLLLPDPLVKTPSLLLALPAPSQTWPNRPGGGLV